MKGFKKFLCAFFFLACLLAVVPAFAELGSKAKRGNTEQGLVNSIQGCLANKDAYCYIDLWPDLDTLTKLVMQYSDSSSADFREALMLQDQPVSMMHADSM